MSPNRPTLTRLSIAVASCLLAAPALADLEPGDYSRALSFDGRDRHYRLHVPDGYDGAPTALVIDLHGASSDSRQQRGLSGYWQLSDEEGFLVAHPDGIGNTWNAGTCCGQAVALGVDDMGFLREVAIRIAQQVNVDARRIYATGLSNGGAMSHRLGCEAADFFAAVAPMAFGVPFIPMSKCQPSRPLPVHLSMGLTDTVVSYSSAAPSFEHWRGVDGCQGDTPDAVVLEGQGRCETFDRCDEGVEVTLCSVVADDFAGTPFEIFAGHILYRNDDFDLARESWDFMKRFATDPPPDLSPGPRAEFDPENSILEVRIGGLPGVDFIGGSGSGSASIAGDGSGGHVVVLDASVWNDSTTVAVFSQTQIAVSIRNGEGVVAEDFSAPNPAGRRPLSGFGGVLPLTGAALVSASAGKLMVPIDLNISEAPFVTGTAVITGISTFRVSIANGPRAGVTGARFSLQPSAGEVTRAFLSVINTVTVFGDDSLNSARAAGDVLLVTPFRVAVEKGLRLPGGVFMTLSFVPEPQTALLLVSAATVLGVIALRQRRSRS